MTFTYDLSTAIGKVRFQIGDDVEAAGDPVSGGIRPDGRNLSDEEIDLLLDAEGDDVMRATAAGCELLARLWSRVPTIQVGFRKEDAGKLAGEFAARAQELRNQHGYGSQGGMFSVGVIRVDGYSDDVPSDAVDASGGEWDDDFTYIKLD
ncbi:MAG: hypothetical protein L0219_07345 [Phycisphaerales bacterium]|nr:hypothetical protein [Phycisphaerales bacterium]